ncbi:CTL-like protein 2 isoform X2 [Fopius arisanus]|nr:PREDICTED: CTL-like protein 2 isoform X2 [Fopius arisanus]
MKRRSCTDLTCLVIFLLFIVVWFSLGIYALSSGNVKRLLAPTDSSGRKCGLDADVADKPFLFFFDLTTCDLDENRCDTPQVCLEKCPDTNWRFDTDQPLEEIRKKIICRPGVNVTHKSVLEIEALINVTACAPMYFKGKSIVHRCFPLDLGTGFIDDVIIEKIKKSETIIKTLAYAQGVFDKVKSSSGSVMGIIVGGAVMCIIYMLILRWLAVPVVCVTIIAVCGLLICLACLSYQSYAKTSSALWLITMIILICTVLVIIIVTVCMWSKVYLACQLIKEASKAIMSVLSSIFFPIIPWLFQIALLFYFFYIVFLFMSIKRQTFAIEHSPNGFPDDCKCQNFNYTVKSSCDPEIFNSKCEENGGICVSTVCRLQKENSPSAIGLAYFIHIVGGIWICIFLSAIGDMTLAGTFASWYWTINKHDVSFFTVSESLWRTVRYHPGTVAFGSFLLTICRLFRLLIDILEGLSEDNSGDCCTGFVRCIVPCLLALLERFVKFMTGNAYIICAIYGKGLCDSAGEALSLIMRNLARTTILNKVVGWVLLGGKVLVTCAMVAIAWAHYKSQDDQFWWAPTVLVGVGTFIVASVFFSVHSMAVDTIFLCFLEDSERNDGTEERPYYMSRGIAKLLTKT